MVITKRGVIVLAIIISLVGIFFYINFFYLDYSLPEEDCEIIGKIGGEVPLMDVPLLVLEVEASSEISASKEEVASDLDVNILEAEKINQEIVLISQKYFEEINLTNFNISYGDYSWGGSVYGEYYGRTIFMGLGDYEPDTYSLVFTHEYAHYLWYRYNLTYEVWGVGEDALHEGLAELYTAFLNIETEKEVWGENAEGRYFPYNIFITPILENDNFDCLYDVFDENDKISSINEILNRLEEFCGISP